MTEEYQAKNIGKGFTVRFYGYQMSDGAAEALERPSGSYEFYIGLKHEDKEIGHTYPTASHFFTKEQYAAIFDAINTPTDFFRAKYALGCVKSKESAEELLEQEGLDGIAGRYPGSICGTRTYIHELEAFIDNLA